MFVGVTVPNARSVARSFEDLALAEISKLLYSTVHEDRLLGLLILVAQFENGDRKTQAAIFRFYGKHIARVNNWDLVDLSAPNIVGAYLYQRGTIQPLRTLVRSRLLWKRRVAVVATYYFIRRNDFAPTLELSAALLNDSHDLMHKATGWMLREVGKRDRASLEKFLGLHASHMPRTMLRYAIERFAETTRLGYLNKRH